MRVKKYKFLAVVALALSFVVGIGIWFDSQYAVPVVMYHSIAPNPEKRNDTISPDNFRRQLEFLKRHRFHVLRLSELAEGIKTGRRFSRRSVVLTFDDGREDNFTTAFPILKEYGLPAIFFVSGEMASTPGYISWEDLGKMLKAGMEIGSHGMTHAYLPVLSPERQRYEVFESKKALESQFKTPVRYYSYPTGGFSPQIQEMVRQAGFQAAVATNRGTVRQQDSLFEIRRVKLTDKNVSDLVLWFKLSGYYNFFRSPKKPY